MGRPRSPESELCDLYDRYREDRVFDHLRLPGIKLVPGFGCTRPKVLLVGEAPGAVENARGRPFCGPSGRMLEKLMGLAELQLEAECHQLCDVETSGHHSKRCVSANSFVTNTVKYRPPGNRTPNLVEVEGGRSYLRAEWNILGCPRAIVAVGSVAKAAMCPAGLITSSLSSIAGSSFIMPDDRTWFVPMFHPAYGLRRESARPLMEQHWYNLGVFLKEEGLL